MKNLIIYSVILAVVILASLIIILKNPKHNKVTEASDVIKRVLPDYAD